MVAWNRIASAARKYDCRVVGESREYVDLISRANGTYYQCKSAIYADADSQSGVIRVNPPSPPGAPA